MPKYHKIQSLTLLVVISAAVSTAVAEMSPEDRIDVLTSQNAALIERVGELDNALANFQGFTSASALADAIYALPDNKRLTVRRFLLTLIPSIQNEDTARLILEADFDGRLRNRPHMSDPSICQAVFTLWNEDPRDNIRKGAFNILHFMDKCPEAWHDVLISKIESGEWDNLPLVALWDIKFLRPRLTTMLDSIPEQIEVSLYPYYFLSDKEKEKEIELRMASRVAAKDLARACLARWGDSSQMEFLQAAFDRAPPNEAIPRLTHKDKAYWAALLAVAGSIPNDLPPIPSIE